MQRNLAAQLNEQEYAKSFADIKPPLSLDAALAEANRCLYCYDAPCITACPTAIDIPTFIKKIATENFKGSARVILESNIMGGTCARVCPVDILCEGACVYNGIPEAKPIDIGRLQRFATDWAFDRELQLFERQPENGKKVAIVGAGPSGLSCAHRLAMLGYAVTVFEGKENAGGLNLYGLAAYKVDNEFVGREVEYITAIGGIEIKYGQWIGKDITISQLLADYDAVFMGMGLGVTPKLNIPGEDLEGVHDAIEFIEALRRDPFSVPIGKTVAVVGAGNTAIDAATQAKRLGAEKVYVIYRRTRNEMPANDYEYGLALDDACEFLWQTHPVRVLGDGFVTGLECVKMALGEPDASGRRSPSVVPGSEFLLPVDMVVKSLGQKPFESLLQDVPGLETKWGRVVIDPESFATSVPKLYAGGDCINGGKETVNAVADGRQAALGIHKMIFAHQETAEV
ncbi:MAG: pyridine nucleotide-disulfide oxidoreductase [Candidatus Melainabacteria bacterium HGW-Melainabacteria-1]|nr:MAG: pyridine nucleotide-disulfide oxidoreductase [Candidatus Melainabacteria bacterium HGW-Melainabacteria-1]